MREGRGREERGQSAGGAVEVAVKRSMAMWAVEGGGLLFPEKQRVLDWCNRIGEIPTCDSEDSGCWMLDAGCCG